MAEARKSTLIQSFVMSLPYASVIPSIFITLYHFNIILFPTLKLLIVIFFFLFVIAPLIYKNTYFFQKNVIFLNFVNIPNNPNYSNPSEYGLDGVFNFYLTTDDGITLGVWQILPEKLLNNDHTIDENYYKSVLNNGQNVLIYNHGNAGNRAAPHRIELYKVLRKHFHIIAYDYRGYGDSSKMEPTEIGLVNDSKTVLQWVRSCTTSHIFIWGHSLGTSISTHTLSQLSAENVSVTGLFLESPFNNLRDEIVEHPFSRPFRYLPWFFYTVIEPMTENKLIFQTDKYIENVNCPIIILHAKDDTVVPFHLGKRLYNVTLENRLKSQGKIFFHAFEPKFHYGHNFIYQAPELNSIISNFVIHCT